MRPGSGRKVPGTARLRTGVAPTGAGMEAAGGYALNASVNVSERPVTGQGVKGMKSQGHGGRIVYDAAYYVGLLRKKISDVNNETSKLRNEIEMQSKDNSQYAQLERKYENLSKSKEALEGQLADYNLALDKTRTSTDPEDVQQMAVHMSEKNRQTGQELDKIFMQRKQRESETAHIEELIEQQYRAIQNRINDLEPGKLRAYNELLARQRELQDRTMNSEQRLNEFNARIRQFESDDKSSSLRKEYLGLERTYQSLRKDYESMTEELEIANMDPKEAHTKFVARVNEFKTGAKNLDERGEQMREEIRVLRRNLADLDNVNSTEEDTGEAAKYELLVKRDQDMTAFMDTFDETRNGIIEDQQNTQFLIIALLEDISKGLEDTTNMPNPDAMGEMENAKTFKEKNLATAQRTMESLQAEKRKRERELEMLRSSEPKLISELSSLREAMAQMRAEMEQFQDIEGMKRAFDTTQNKLHELKQLYMKRRDTMKQQVQALSMEHDVLKKSLNNNEIARDIDDTEKRLKHYERSIFELKEFVETKTRETDYEMVKASCISMTNQLNTQAVKRSDSNNMYSSQAKW